MFVWMSWGVNFKPTVPRASRMINSLTGMGRGEGGRGLGDRGMCVNKWRIRERDTYWMSEFDLHLSHGDGEARELNWVWSE